MNLINETHHSYERREYAFIVLREYTIISQLELRRKRDTLLTDLCVQFIIIAFYDGFITNKVL